MRKNDTHQISGSGSSPLSDLVRCALLLLADRLLLCISAGSPPVGKKRILVIKLDAIGDFILWLDAAKYLRMHYSSEEYELFLLGNQTWCDLAGELPYFDHVWPLDRCQFIENLSYRFTIMKKIRRAGFDTIIQPTFSRELFMGDEIVRTSGVRERIGYVGNSTNTSRQGKIVSDRWYTRLIPATPGPLMELVRNAEFMRGLGATDFRAAIPDLNDLADRYATPLLAPYYVIVPGAGVALKQWPLENFREVAKRIHHLTGWKGVVCGAPGEEELGSFLVNGVDIPLTNIAGKTSLLELAGIIAGARIVIGNDSSSIHLAAAVSTPAVCLLGGGQYGRFFPYRVEVPVPSFSSIPVPVVNMMDCFGCDWRCKDEIKSICPALCVSQISVDMVMYQIVKVIPDIALES